MKIKKSQFEDYSGNLRNVITLSAYDSYAVYLKYFGVDLLVQCGN